MEANFVSRRFLLLRSFSFGVMGGGGGGGFLYPFFPLHLYFSSYSNRNAAKTTWHVSPWFSLLVCLLYNCKRERFGKDSLLTRMVQKLLALD